MDIKINQDRCKGCGLCVEFFCPNNVFGEKEKIGKRGFKEVIVVSPDKCNGCGLCEYCPEGAIKVTGRRDLPLDYFWRAMKKRKKEAAKNNLPRGGWKKEKTCHPGIHNISGNTAFVWGALDAGCDAGIFYPITPSTPQIYETLSGMRELNEISSREFKKKKRFFYQMEKEDVCMIGLCAASLAGAKAMTATSGPGFSRMAENLSFALTNELPLVIVDVQRTGPSTGRPTASGAGEVKESRWSSHGGTEHIVLYPSTVQDCYNLAVRAFNLSEQYRVPVIVLMEASMANLEERVEIPEEINVFDRIYIPGASPFGPVSESVIPSMPCFGEGEFLKITGLTHNQEGVPCANSPKIHENMVRHQRQKIISKTEELTDVEEIFLDNAEVMIVAYGHTARAVEWAVRKAREKGIKVGMLKLRTLYPFPEKKIEEWSKKVFRIDVPEVNQGQLFYIVRESSVSPVVSLPQPDGENIDPRRILRYLEESSQKYYRKMPPSIAVPALYYPSEWKREKQAVPRKNFSPQTPFCKGCGLGVLRSCFLQAIRDLKLDADKLVVVSGIGCAARMPNHLPFDSANTTHGYSVPFASLVKWISSDLRLIVISGDGDEFNIGLGETLFGAKRNVPITVICFNNFLFGMTGGQAGATTPLGSKTSTTPLGSDEAPFDLVKIMLAAGAQFAVRCPISKPIILTKSIKEAITFNEQEQGFAFIEVISPCLNQYTKRNMPISSCEVMRKLNEAYISREQNPSEELLRKKFDLVFPARKELGKKAGKEELLQLVFGRFSNLEEYLTFLSIREEA